MSDIYIVHSSDDNTVTGEIVALLEAHWEVWWDDTLVGNFAGVIHEELAATKCVIPIWTSSSIQKETVLDEVRLAKEAGVIILPIVLDGCKVPYPFGQLGNVNFSKWDGKESHPAFQQLLRKLNKVIPRRVPPTRPIVMSASKLALPAVFLSVSSHETQLVPLEAVRALRVFGTPSILISAYDLLKGRRPSGIVRELQKIRRAGGIVLVDSGNYEATRRDDAEWTPNRFHEAVNGIPHDWCYCFDVMNPSRDPTKAAKEVIDAVERDTKATGSIILPIVHAARIGGGYDATNFPGVVAAVAKQLTPPIIAVAERELGRGLTERAKTVRAIRQTLDALPFYQPLHILGTGNPWSIAILTAAGADSFDGLEWCRMVIDHDKHRLNHFQHFDFFMYQTEWSESEVAVAALKDDKIDYAGKVAFHNLEYYRGFVPKLREHAHAKRMERLLVTLLGDSSTDQLAKEIPDLFK